MKLPARVPRSSAPARWLAVLAVAAASAALVGSLERLPFTSAPISRLNWLLYDSLYNLRDAQDLTGGEVVVVAVDQASLDFFNSEKANPRFGWPWPRGTWGRVVQFLESCGARAVVFDMLFSERSLYSDYADDDRDFAEYLDAAQVPVAFGTVVGERGATPFAPPVRKPAALGAVNVEDAAVVRRYAPFVHGRASLAALAVQSVGDPLPAWARGKSEGPFLLHYYGPHRSAAGRPTFRYVNAAPVVVSAMDPSTTTANGLDPGLFRGKIVLVGTVAAGTFDTKASPLSGQYPGVEIQATAIENLLRGQRVRELPKAAALLAAFVCSALGAAGALLPRRVTFKLLAAACVFALIAATAALLFRRAQIVWLPWAGPLLAALAAVVLGFAWSYLAQDRQRRLILKALSQYVSPAVADELNRDPSSLKLGGERREMTVMFTDIAHFTDIAEAIGEERTGALLNFYLDQMSDLVLAADGTLDKYIGDAIMCFWNAPLPQADHAARACRAALAMRRREADMAAQVRALGADRLHTRVGIATGPMICGNMGSSRKFAYSVIGDSVNLASRLEGANKLYGTQILLSETTAALVGGMFALRKVDVLRVKGKLQPMAVYELLGEAAAERHLVEAYESALAAYQSRRWDEAVALLAKYPQDPPSAALLARARRYSLTPPPADWDGVYVAGEK